MSKTPDDSGPSAGTRTARSKFLDTVKAAADASHLELVVEFQGPNTGFGMIQKPDGFTSLFSFHFDFENQSAVFYLGTASVETAQPDQKRQIEYKDGEAMEQVLNEIRQKINEATKEAFPQLNSLSSTRPGPPPPSGTAKGKDPRSAKSNAVIWGQDMKTLKATRYHHKKPPRRGYGGLIAGIVLLAIIIFMLVPMAGSSRGITDCGKGTCETSSAYYQSVSFLELGVGGVYIPQNNGSGIFNSITVQPANGTLTSGISLHQFYIAW